MNDINILPSRDPMIPARLNETVQKQHMGYAPTFFKAYNFPAVQQAMEGFLQKPGASLLVAYKEEQPVGYLLGWSKIREENAFAVEERVFWVDQMAVLPQYRGHSIGARLLEAAESTAVANGFTEMELSVWVSNPDAIRFYEKNGYASFIRTMRKPLQ